MSLLNDIDMKGDFCKWHLRELNKSSLFDGTLGEVNDDM